MSDALIAYARRLPAFELAMVFAIILLVVGFNAAEPRVLSGANIRNVLSQTSYLAIFACAQAVVILVRGFDLSLGTTISVVSVVTAMAMTSFTAVPIMTGFVAGLGVGLAIGICNGFCVAWLKINPFIVTLGTYNILLALSSTISGGFPIAKLPAEFSQRFSQGAVIGLPASVVAAILVALILELVLRGTVFGRKLYLIGSNPRAAHGAGINIRVNLAAAYVVCSLLIAFGAILLTARTGSGEPNLGGQLTLLTIAAAVIGGMSLRGGEGSMAAPVLGALFVTTLSNGMNLTRVDGYIQSICLGVLIIAALGFDRFQHRRR